jgi:16S rRNA (adenine1518-N6/adenine1519-N6)-dimethyltransferase
MRQPYGQNFLIDKNIVHKIAESADLGSHDHVVEIGPGKGILTTELVSRAQTVTAVELDRDLAAALTAQFSSSASVHIVDCDFLTWQLPEQPYKVVANLPYYLSTAILAQLLPSPHWISAVVMVQKEVGDRIAAVPDTKEYGFFSLFCQYYATVKILFKVAPGCFSPQPKVDSVVLRFDNRRPAAPDPKLFPVIRLAFQQRRKTILNTLSNGLHSPKESVSAALKDAAINPMSRPENLTFEDFQNLTFCLKRYIIL